MSDEIQAVYVLRGDDWVRIMGRSEIISSTPEECRITLRGEGAHGPDTERVWWNGTQVMVRRSKYDWTIFHEREVTLNFISTTEDGTILVEIEVRYPIYQDARR